MFDRNSIKLLNKFLYILRMLRVIFAERLRLSLHKRYRVEDIDHKGSHQVPPLCV